MESPPSPEMFIYDKPDRRYPDTEQVSDTEWTVECPFWHVHEKTGVVTFIPPSRIGGEPVAYTTDYRSGPAILDASVPKQGHYSAAWLKHDFGYASESKSRAKLDWELLQDLQELGASWWQRNKVWLAVRALGWDVWNKHDPYKVSALKAHAARAKRFYQMP
jgi:hypothetical protein